MYESFKIRGGVGVLGGGIGERSSGTKNGEGLGKVWGGLWVGVVGVRWSGVGGGGG